MDRFSCCITSTTLTSSFTYISPARLGVSEREILEEGMYLSLCISLARMKEMPNLIALVGRVFDSKIPFYFGKYNRTDYEELGILIKFDWIRIQAGVQLQSWLSSCAHRVGQEIRKIERL